MRILKETAWWLLVRTGLTQIAARLNRRKFLVLLYHGVDGGAPDPVLNFDGLHVHVDRFERQMRYLAAHYNVVPLDRLLNGEHPAGVQKPLASITFDDGYHNVCRYAYPVLKRLGLPATVFTPTDYLQGGPALWWDRLSAMVASSRRAVVKVAIRGSERSFRLGTAARKRTALRALVREFQQLPPPQREARLARLAEDLDVETRALRPFRPLSAQHLREMARDSITVGGHGCSHDSFLHLSSQELLDELVESKRILESITGQPVSWLSYPYGHFSPEVAKMAAHAGYHGAVTTIEGLNDGISDPYAVRRFGVDDRLSFSHFVVVISGLRDLMENRTGFRWPRRWPLATRGARARCDLNGRDRTPA